jgi:hypothetical protein
MTTQYSSFDSRMRSSEELETTEPDFWLDDIDVLPDSQTEAINPAFFDAKTEPARRIDEIHDTLPGIPCPEGDPSREQELLAFLDTVRRVFGDGHG